MTATSRCIQPYVKRPNRSKRFYW